MEEPSIYQLKYLVIPTFLYEDNRLSGLQLKLAAFVYSFKGENFCFSNELLATMFHVSRPATISDALNKLKELGLIKIDYKTKTTGGTTRYIRLTVDRMSEAKADLRSSVSPKMFRLTEDRKSYNINDNNIKDNTPIVPLQGKLTLYIDEFNRIFATKYKPTPGREKKLRERLKLYTIDQLIEAIRNLGKSKFHRGENDRGWIADPDFLIRSDEQIDKWLNQTGTPPKKSPFSPEFELYRPNEESN